jgi:hypothetical protein
MSKQRPTDSTPEVSREFIVSKRDELLNEIGQIDSNVIMQFGQRGATVGKLGWFSDWPDSFNNHGTWYKTWGKAGDMVVDPPYDAGQFSLGYAIKMLFARIRVLIFGR